MMMDPRQLIKEEEVLAAFGAYLLARQNILSKKNNTTARSTEKTQLLNKCWEHLASARKELDCAWAKIEH